MLLLLLACAPVDVCQGSPTLDGDGLSDYVQFYVRTPKGKCMGPKLLNALLCMHAPAPCHDASSS